MASPWHGESIARSSKPPPAGPRARKLSILEAECGITEDEYEQIHATQRARVRAKYNPVELALQRVKQAGKQ